MICHIVAFKVKAYASSEEKRVALNTLKTELLKLPSSISVIRSFEVGIDLLQGPFSYDLIINSTFDSLDDLESYRIHPAHQAFIEFNKDYTVEKVMVDYHF